MKHHIKTIALLGVLAVLGGCASSERLDADIASAQSVFNTHKEMDIAFKGLEQRIDSGVIVTRNDVHAAGFDPSKTAVEIMDWTEIGNKFTAGGNEVLAAALKADGGQVLPAEVKDCLKGGKTCTAYRVTVESIRSEELPETTMDTVKSVLDLKEVRTITKWKYGCIIVFNNNKAIYAQVEEDVAPNVTYTTEKNSFWKKVGKAATP